MAKLVAKRYALSLFETGLELNKIKEFNDELNFIKKIFESEPRLLQILHHPKISKVEKRSLLNDIFKDKISLEMVNFLYILIDKRREDFILEIAQSYKVLFNEHQEILKVMAITAVPMEDKAKEKLSLVLKNKFNKNIELSNVIDKSLIGGVLLKIENKIMDGSLRGQLKSMELAIKGKSL